MQNYTPYMESIFKLTASNLNLKDGMSFNAQGFISIFITLLKRGKYSDFQKLKDAIKRFEQHIDSFVKHCSFVETIDKYDSIPLNTKIKIMSIFRQYINEAYSKIDGFYNEESTKELKHDYLYMLTNQLDVYLKKCTFKKLSEEEIVNNLESLLMKNTERFLVRRVISEDKYEKLLDDRNKIIISQLNKKEQKTYLLFNIFYIIGYDFTDESKREEVLNKLSAVIECTKSQSLDIMLSMVKRIRIIAPFLFYRNEKNEDDFGIHFP